MKKSSVWTIILVLVMAVAFVASGCAKKQTVKEDAASKAAVAKKEAAKPAAPAPAAPKAAPAAPAPAAPKAAAPKAAAKAAPTLPDPKDLTIWFAFDDYSLSPQAKENLEKIASWMAKNQQAKIQIQGNTCSVGTAEYNLALGDRRANSAKKYLEGLGVNSSRLSTISFGLEKPIAPNTDEVNRSRNRRDEFVSK